MAENESTEKKNKKISKMNKSEVESALKKAMETMNGQNAKFVQHLIARQAELSK